ncbi:MAG TPA: hypothetical protein VGJ86_12935 [Acidimicrobiales bacterium]|jgi:hypothetical protein
MTEAPEVVDRLTTALEAKASRVTVASTPFDPDRPSKLGLTEPEPSRRRVMLSAAALVLALGLIGGTVVARAIDDDPPTDTATSSGDPSTYVIPGGDEGPGIALGDFPVGALVVHAGQVLCLHPADPGPSQCSAPGLKLSAVVDGTWYIGVAWEGDKEPPVVARRWGEPSFAGDPARYNPVGLANQTATQGDWSFTLTEVPDGYDSVWLLQGIDPTTSFDRPGG